MSESSDIQKDKRLSKKTVITKQLEKYALDNELSNKTRYISIKCGLKHALKGNKNKKMLEQFFHRKADIIGSHRYWTGLFANYLAITKLSDLTNLIEIKKTFYDKCISTLFAFKNGKKTVGATFYDDFQLFAKAIHLSPSDIDQSTKYEIRQFIAKDMAVCARKHISEELFKRCKGYFRYQISKTFPKLDKKIVYKLSKSAVCCTFALPSDLNQKMDTLNSITELDISFLKTSIKEARSLLKRCFIAASNKDKPFSYILKSQPHLVLPLMKHISSFNEDERSPFREDVKSAKGDEERMKEVMEKHKNRASKNFSLLPIWKLQPAFVKYSYTVLCEQFGKDNINPNILDNGLFNVSFIPQVKQRDRGDKSIAISGFQTDGHELVVMLQTLKDVKSISPNTDKLVEAGYSKLTKPKRKVSLDRGVYLVTETRFDCKHIHKKMENIKVITIDPGVSKVVSICEADLKDCENSSEILKSAKFEQISNETYRKMTGSNILRQEEISRRTKNHKYETAIEDLSKEIKKTSRFSTFIGYCKAAKEHFLNLKKELMRKRRKSLKFFSKRKIDSVLHDLANRIFKKTSYKKKYDLKTLSDNEKRILRKKIREKRKEPKKKRVVFFGNGSFRSGGSGYAPVPRKKLVKFLSITGLTYVLDEFCTSKMCPGGCGCEMKDVDKESRVRRCTNVSIEGDSNCCSLRSLNSKCFEEDRDKCANINMCRCAYAAVVYKKRPAYLCRPKKNAVEEKLENDLKSIKL